MAGTSDRFLPAKAPAPPSSVQIPSAHDTGLALEGGVETALGGVFFLINLMCALDLPAAFEADWHLAGGLGAWGVLDAIGRSLLASRADAVEDPIWVALAQLSGRRLIPRLAPGANYRLPDTWLAHAPADGHAAAAWGARRGWLRVWSKADYVLSETRLGAVAPATAAWREARHYGSVTTPARAAFSAAPITSLAGPLVAGLDRNLKRWLALAVPFIRLRLARALGITSDDESLGRALLARRGRLFVAPTHVDLVMGLDSVALPVRLAGLDRSPGWLGVFGRVILFHFE